MESIRIFSRPRQSMQRLGFLKYITWRASLSATNNISTLGKELIAAISQKVTVPMTPELKDYIKKALTGPTYKTLQNSISRPDGTHDKPLVQIEIQDIYLADPEIPSRRGRLTEGHWKEYPFLGLSLGLLRKGTYSLLVRGQSFLSLTTEAEIKAFSKIDLIPQKESLNPFTLTLPQRLLLLFSFIERDGSVLSGIYSRLPKHSEGFTDRDLGDFLPAIYRSLAKEWRNKIRSGDDLLTIQKLIDTSNVIESLKKKARTGGTDALKHQANVRLEPFVDLDLLSKPDPFASCYRIIESTIAFFEPLINAQSIDHFLRHSFFEASNKAFNLHGKHRTDKETVWPAIQKAYTVLKSPLGYAPILEISLLAGIYSITETGVYFEISEALECLKMLQKERRELVRFNVDRWGALTFVKFNDT